MEIDRRDFRILPAGARAGSMFAAQDRAIPWQRKIRRLGQVNMTEHDPVALNVDEWADYWADMKVDAEFLKQGGAAEHAARESVQSLDHNLIHVARPDER